MTLMLYTTWYIWWFLDVWYQGTRVMVMLCALTRCMVYSVICHNTRGFMLAHLIHELQTGVALQHDVTYRLTSIIIGTDNIMLFNSSIGDTKSLINILLFYTKLFIYLSLWNCYSLIFFVQNFFHSVKKLLSRYFSFIGATIVIILHL